MESLFPAIPFGILLMIGLCVVVLIAAGGISLFMLIFKAGVIVHEAQKPAHLDAGDYRLEQGHEVRAEGQVQRRTENTEP
jgi:hypothetical protein